MNFRKRSLQVAPLALASLVLLTGCDGKVSAVKKQIYPDIDSSMRLGKALETRTDCENGKWDSYSDKRGRDVVRYTCTLPQLYLDTFKSQALALAQFKSPEEEKNTSSQIITELENKKNDVPRLRNYLQTNYSTLVALNTIDRGALQAASESLFSYFWDPKPTQRLNSNGALPLPTRASSDAECQKRQVSSCDAFYNAETKLTELFNGLTKSLGYNKTHIWFLMPDPEKNISDINVAINHSSDKGIISSFKELVTTLLIKDQPLLSSDAISQGYSALIPEINEQIDHNIASQKENYHKWQQNYNQTAANATFSAVQEDFYWYIDDNGDPVDNGGTLTFTRNGKSTTVQMKDSDDYLAVAYQSIPSDRIPNIYLNAMRIYNNIWAINSRGGI